MADAVGREDRDAGGLEDADVRRRGGHRGRDVHGEENRGGGADACALIESERDEQRVAGDPLQRPSRQLRDCRPAAELRRPEHVEPVAHLFERAAYLRGGVLQTGEPRGRAAAQQRGRAKDEAQQHDRQDRGHDQRALVAAEQADGAEHHGAEHAQRDQVQDGLRDDRAEHDRQALAHAAEAARHNQGTRRLAEARG